MQHYWSLDDLQLQCTWITIGSFDGVHLGHQAIIKELVTGARRAKALSVVITFHPHPAVILKKRNHSYYLTAPEERAILIGDLGVEMVVTYPFTSQVAEMSARRFVEHLHAHLGFERLIVGFNFALGKGREGDIATLSKFGEEYGYSVQPIGPITNGNEVISSSQIRARLSEGDVVSATRLLGRPYRISGAIVRGDARGRLIGVPTANLDVWSERALPKSGVYVCRAIAVGEKWNSVVNIGYRPTFESAPVQPRVEAHLLDFDGDLYGESISLDFVERLRDEQRFSSVDNLVAQIQQDIAKTRTVLLSSE